MKRAKRVVTKNEPAAPRKVNFFLYANDLQCPLLAAIGLTTRAISALVGLTESQVMYRIMAYENAIRREGEDTSRAKYRAGKSDIAKMLVNNVTSSKSDVRKLIVTRMDRKGLYTPRPKGVMRNKAPSEANRIGK